MTRTVRWILALLALAAGACVLFLAFRPAAPDRPVARIILNGTIVNEIDLTGDGLPQTFVYEGPGGFTNTVEAEHGRIRVREAGCPDQVCVHQGWISDGTVPIVCLPNQLIIEISGGGDDLDTATG